MPTKAHTSPKKKQGRPSKAERRAAERRARQRRQIAYALGAIAVVAVVIVLLTTGGGSSTGTKFGAVSTSARPRAEPLRAGDQVPAFSTTAMGGGQVSWDDYEGKPTVLSVWAPWCPYCQKELPVMGRVSADFPDVEVVSVVTAVDLHPGPTAEGFMHDNGLTFPVGLDDRAGTLGRVLGIVGFPTVYYVGPDGLVVKQTEGETPEDAMRANFEELAKLGA